MRAIAPVIVTLTDFLSHEQGRRFIDVVSDTRLSFRRWIEFFNHPDRQQRMCDSEVDHLRPALAGVIRELENHPDFRPFLAGHDALVTRRARQSVVVLTRLVMAELGWSRTGRKRPLRRLSRWFARAEHFVPPGGLPYPAEPATRL
jgi:hypothetical protein